MIKSKQTPAFFHAIIPAIADIDIIQQQLKQLRLAYNKQPDMLRLMEKDLFERWMELYQAANRKITGPIKK